jgi:hypothetical protein
MAIGLGLDYVGLTAVKMLFWSAVLNGALAPPLLVLVVLPTSRADVMGDRRNGPLLRWLGWICAGVMPIRHHRYAGDNIGRRRTEIPCRRLPRRPYFV